MTAASEAFYIIGHRGAAGERMENSMEGFHHALALDIDAIEIDIREHSSQLWVIHDRDLGRLTGTSGLFESLPNPGEILLRNGEAVPLLQQVLDLYWGKKPVNIEIKSIVEPRLLLDLLARYDEPDTAAGMPWIVISSFDHPILLRLKQLGCRWPLAPISAGNPLQLDAELDALAPWSWHFDDEYLDLGTVRHLRERGVATLVYTVNDPARAAFLRQHGIAGIFTDHPTQMLESLGASAD